jgi:hypothetical protein
MSPGRIVPVGGLTYPDANTGRFITEGPDVCNYKAKIRELDPGLDCHYDQIDEEWVITWWDERKKQDMLVLTCGDLAQGYDAVCRARNDRPGALTGDQLSRKLEKEQEAEEEKNLHAFRQIAGDAAERMIHALKKDGFFDHENIYGPKEKPALSARASSIRGDRSFST